MAIPIRKNREKVKEKESKEKSKVASEVKEGAAETESSTQDIAKKELSNHRVLSFLSGIYLEDKSVKEDTKLSGLVVAAESRASFSPSIVGLEKSLVAEFIEGIITKYFCKSNESNDDVSNQEEDIAKPPPTKKSLQIETL